MIVRGFRQVGWVAAVGAAALGCYMVSLNVAAERADLHKIERQIVMAKRDIRSLETELGTRGRLSQLEHWNAEILALSAPTSKQFLQDEVMLARFDRRAPTIEDRAKVQLASADVAVKPAPQIAPADYAAAAKAAETDRLEPEPLVRRASAVAHDDAAAGKPAVRKASLLDGGLAGTIDAAAKREQTEGAARR